MRMKRWWAQKQKGFTIVELLIVIVVIGILAAIVIVAYNGIQNRANDTAVQSDLANFSKKINLINVETGTYPTVLDSTMGLKFSRSSYRTTSNNVYYCADSTGFAIAARAKTGTFMYSSQSGQGTYAGAWSGADFCGSVSLTFRQHGYDMGTSAWLAWVSS